MALRTLCYRDRDRQTDAIDAQQLGNWVVRYETRRRTGGWVESNWAVTEQRNKNKHYPSIDGLDGLQSPGLVLERMPD